MSGKIVEEGQVLTASAVGKFIIDPDIYQNMQEELLWLSCLEQAGVDNWSGIDHAYELYEEQK